MLRFSDFATGKKRFYNLSRGLYRKMKFRTYLTLVSKIDYVIVTVKLFYGV